MFYSLIAYIVKVFSCLNNPNLFLKYAYRVGEWTSRMGYRLNRNKVSISAVSKQSLRYFLETVKDLCSYSGSIT